MASINQTGNGIRLPNFCNLGVMLRSLVVAHLFIVAAAVLKAPMPAAIWVELLDMASFAEPALIVSLAALCLARPALHAMGYLPSIVAIAAFEVLVAWSVAQLAQGLLPDRRPMPFANLSGRRFYYEVGGEGETLAPARKARDAHSAARIVIDQKILS